MADATHESWMTECIALAQRGAGFVEPNPCVGAVIVKNGEIVGRGYHQELGGPHAEVNAFADAGALASGADLYVTLEPCSTTGRTPPCASAVIDAGIKRVFIGTIDPNPSHAGRAIKLLEEAGVEVTTDILRGECEALIEDFRLGLARSRPVVVAKWASTLDGRIATRSGDSKWITSAEARTCVHQERARSDAILVGVGTVLADDPSLTVRHVAGTSPQPVVLDSSLRIPTESALVKSPGLKPWIYCAAGVDPAKAASLREFGCDVVEAGSVAGRPDLAVVLEDLKQRGIARLMVEGGAQIHGAFLDAGLVDVVHAYLAPKILGDQEAPGAVAGRSPLTINGTVDCEWLHINRCGPDLQLIGRIRRD